MKFNIFYFHEPLSANSIPASINIWGMFKNVSDAVQHALFVVTTHSHFKGWCAAFEIEDANGKVVLKQTKEHGGAWY